MQFGRHVVINIGNQTESAQIVYDEKTRQVPNITIEGKKSNKAEPNTFTVSIDNLSSNIRNRISSKEFNLVIVKVGRDNEELRTLFVGKIEKSEHKRDSSSATITTTLECSDGGVQYAESYTSKTLKKGMTDNEIVQEIIKDMPEITAGAMQFPKDRVLPRAKTMVGNSRDELTQIANRNGCDWSIQEGKLIFMPKDKVLPDSYGYLISQSTGMQGTPQKNSNGGLDVTMFLNTSIFINSLIRVNSIIEDYNGDYKVLDIEYKLATRANEWTQKCSVVGGEFQIIEKGKK